MSTYDILIHVIVNNMLYIQWYHDSLYNKNDNIGITSVNLGLHLKPYFGSTDRGSTATAAVIISSLRGVYQLIILIVGYTYMTFIVLNTLDLGFSLPLPAMSNGYLGERRFSDCLTADADPNYF